MDPAQTNPALVQAAQKDDPFVDHSSHSHPHSHSHAAPESLLSSAAATHNLPTHSSSTSKLTSEAAAIFCQARHESRAAYADLLGRARSSSQHNQAACCQRLGPARSVARLVRPSRLCERDRDHVALAHLEVREDSCASYKELIMLTKLPLVLQASVHGLCFQPRSGPSVPEPASGAA